MNHEVLYEYWGCPSKYVNHNITVDFKSKGILFVLEIHL